MLIWLKKTNNIVSKLVNWIFTTKLSDEELKQILKQKIWPIKETTRFRNYLATQDKVILYRGIPYGSKFACSFILKSEAQKIADEKYELKISDAVLWKNPVLIEDHLDDLELIRYKKNWQRYLMGGIIRLSNKDYKTITSFNAKQ